MLEAPNLLSFFHVRWFTAWLYSQWAKRQAGANAMNFFCGSFRKKTRKGNTGDWWAGVGCLSYVLSAAKWGFWVGLLSCLMTLIPAASRCWRCLCYAFIPLRKTESSWFQHDIKLVWNRAQLISKQKNKFRDHSYTVKPVGLFTFAKPNI